MTSLNPVKTVGAQIVESLRRHRSLPRGEARARAVEALREVGIAHPEARAGQYPHQLSGGMRQRVMIAMALACRPKLLIADEPTTALDVTVQAQIMELMADLQERFGMAIVLITHDLGVVAQVADQVLVMYAGRPVEAAGADDLFERPRMPYTRALLESMPRPDVPGGAVLDPIRGAPPNLLDLPPGCAFHPRCGFARPECASTVPALEEKAPGHAAACVLTDDDLPGPSEGERVNGT
jgi:oligopeptide transport system ATP-binding protein